MNMDVFTKKKNEHGRHGLTIIFLPTKSDYFWHISVLESILLQCIRNSFKFIKKSNSFKFLFIVQAKEMAD